MKKFQLTIKRTPIAAAVAAAMLLTSAQSGAINITDRTEPIPTYSEIQQGGTEGNAVMDVFGNPYLRLTIAAKSDGNKYEYAVSTAESVDTQQRISTIRLKAPDYISISSDTSESAVNAVKGSTIELGNSEGSGANAVRISSTSDGLRAAYDANPSFGADTLITIQAKNIDISSKGSSIISKDKALVELNADRIEINSQGQDKASIVAHANGRVRLNADHIEIHSSSGTAIDVNQQIYAGSVNNTEIVIGNKNGDGVVIIDGDIFFNSGTGSRPLYVDVPISIAFNGPESSWTGNARLLYLTDTNNPDYDEKYYSTSGLKISLSNGAQWTPSLINKSTSSVNNEEYTSESQAINFLTLSGGIINLNKGAGQVVEIEQLSGSGGVFNFEAEVDADRSIIETGKIHIEKIDPSAAGTPHFDVNYTGITADDLTDIQDQMTKLANNSVVIDEGSASQTHVVAEGNLRGKVTLDISSDGTLSEVRTAPNMKLANLSSVNALNLVHWRSEINHLTKRMGDVRTSAADSGSWARVYGGESRWGNGNSVEMKRASVQVGVDARINSSWLLGGAFSYSDSDADLADGEAEGDAYGLAAYATYLADNGAYVDLIGRYGYLKSDVSTGNMSIDNASHAFSLSVEGGHQFRFVNDRGYVEPQVELTYGYVRGDDEVATNGVRIRQDDFQSLVARVGVRTGFDLPERAGTFYAALSYSYDFLGEAEAEASQNNLSAALREDLGGGWVSYGIGAQFRIGDNVFAYGELERTSGGKVDNPYLFNCGVRWNF